MDTGSIVACVSEIKSKETKYTNAELNTRNNIETTLTASLFSLACPAYLITSSE